MTETISQVPAAAPQQVPETLAQPVPQASSDAPTVATFDMLMKKPRRVIRAGIAVPGPDDTIVQLQMKFQALTASEYDELVEKYPPVGKEKQNGASWDVKRFPIALVAASCIEPKMSYEQVEQLSQNPDWASGEFNDLFVAAMRATQGGLDIPFNVRD